MIFKNDIKYRSQGNIIIFAINIIYGIAFWNELSESPILWFPFYFTFLSFFLLFIHGINIVDFDAREKGIEPNAFVNVLEVIMVWALIPSFGAGLMVAIKLFIFILGIIFSLF